MNLQALESFCAQIGCECRRQEPMYRHTSFQIGGPAALFLLPEGEKMAAEIIAFAHREGIPLFVMGRGSNLLVRETGIAVPVLCIGPKMGRIERQGNLLLCEAGVPLSRLCQAALEAGLSGLEFAYGIPGSVGGAIYMNAGAYGGEISQVLAEARHITPEGEPGCFLSGQLDFSYRHSRYTGSGFCITGGSFVLKPAEKEEIRAKMEDFLSRRREKQPLEYPSAGSTFKRPQTGFASQMIDQCGLKGVSVGGAQVSEKHAGFVVNAGGAGCSDVLELMSLVRSRVAEQTGVLLEPEVVLVGPKGMEKLFEE